MRTMKKKNYLLCTVLLHHQILKTINNKYSAHLEEFNFRAQLLLPVECLLLLRCDPNL